MWCEVLSFVKMLPWSCFPYLIFIPLVDCWYIERNKRNHCVDMDILSSLTVLALSPAAKKLVEVACNAIMRCAEPYLYARGEKIKAKKELELYEEYPHKYLEYCAGIIDKLGDNKPEGLNKQLQNISKVINFAGTFVADADSIDTDADDESWYDRFFDEARYVSDEMLQNLWGRLLKEKICSPNGVNIRVLYFIRDLDRSELDAIIKSFRFFLDKGVVPTGLIGEFPDLCDNWLTLSSLRLVVSTPLSAFQQVSWSLKSPKKGDTISSHRASFVIDEIYSDGDLDFPCFSLSTEGEVLARLLDTTMSDEELQVYVGFLNKIWQGKASLSYKRDQ